MGETQAAQKLRKLPLNLGQSMQAGHAYPQLNGGIDVHEICNSDPKLVFVLHDIGDSRLNFWRMRIRWQRG